jgi:hypothetical protein
VSDALTDASAIAAELHELARPVRERLERVEQEIETTEVALQGLKTVRTQLRNALRTVDPTFAPEARTRKRARTTPKQQPSEKAIATVSEYLEAHRAELANGHGMTSGRLRRRDDWPYSESYTKAILDTLHERGVIRLDHVGRGGAHVFALV